MKRISFVKAALALVLGVAAAVHAQTRWDEVVTSEPAGYVVDGDGNVTLNSAEALAWFSHEVAAGSNFVGKVVTLEADVDIGAYLFTPIGSPSASFGGTFDGGGYTITDLRVSENGGFVGLFGYLLGSAVVKNVNINNADVTNNVTPANSVWSEGAAAAIGGTAIAGSVVSNIHVTGNIKIAGGNHTAGVVGLLYYGWIYDCTVAGASGSTITGIGTDEGQIGGILGFVSEGGYKVVNCHVSDIMITGSNNVGGIGGIIHVGDTFVDCTVSNVTVVNLGTATGLMAGWNLG